MIGRGAVFAGWMACLAACDPGESGESGDINPVTRAAVDSARMAAVGVFKVAQICQPNGDVANTIVAGVPPARDSATLMAIGRSYAGRHLSAAGVEVVFFADSAHATCTFPMDDAAVAALVANYTVNRRRSEQPEFLNYAPGKHP